MPLESRTRTLNCRDILILTLIFWGAALYGSTVSFWEAVSRGGIAEPLKVTAADDYSALIVQSCQLALGLAYLRWRRFDFSVWTLRLLPGAILGGVVLFAAAGLSLDVYFLLYEKIVSSWGAGTFLGDALQIESGVTLASILYGLLNGVYEELFFLGICLSVAPRHVGIAFAFSLLVRFGFHTYQGLGSALGIGVVLGTLYFVLYARMNVKNLVPYFISHAIADIVGLSVLQFFA